MTVLTNQTKHSITPIVFKKTSSSSWDDSSFAWDSSSAAWDGLLSNVSNQTKHSTTLINQTKS